MLINETPYEEDEELEELQVLRMEHIYFPLVILVAGLLLSTLTFIAEIIIKRFQKNVQL